MTPITCGVCICISIALMIYSRKKEKRELIKKLKFINYSVCMLLIISTIIECIFRDVYIEHYIIFRTVDNTLFGIVLLTGLAGIIVNLVTLIRKRK